MALAAVGVVAAAAPQHMAALASGTAFSVRHASLTLKNSVTLVAFLCFALRVLILPRLKWRGLLYWLLEQDNTLFLFQEHGGMERDDIGVSWRSWHNTLNGDEKL
jgi:hypothetical protein